LGVSETVYSLATSLHIVWFSQSVPPAIHCTELYCHKHPNKNTGGEHKGFILLMLVRRSTSMHIVWFSHQRFIVLNCIVTSTRTRILVVSVAHLEKPSVV